MRRISCSVALMTVLGLCAGAGGAGAQVEFGFQAGANLSRLAGDTSLIFAGPEFADFTDVAGELDSPKLGMTMGLFMSVRVDRDVSFRLEALYSELGAQGEYAGTVFIDGSGLTDLAGDVSIKTTYVEVPVALLFPLPGLAHDRWRGMLGGAVAFATNSELRLDSVINGYLYSDPLDLDDRVRSTVTHGLLGIEFIAYVKETPFLLDLRYEFDLDKFDAGIGGDPDQDYRHRTVVATLGILF